MNLLNSHHFLTFLPATHLFILLAALTTAEDATSSTLNRTDVNFGSAPVVVSRIDHIVVKEGNSALIDCNVRGNPSPRYKWYNSNGCLLKEEEN
uniref:Ig-like domain-containing protein n=1 Tax=Pelusios castaneus TaxID=367368 RepID=A0A8C8S7J5_9SAUR